MIDRVAIKGQAREALRTQRGTSIGLCILLMVFGFAFSLLSNYAFPQVTLTYGYSSRIYYRTIVFSTGGILLAALSFIVYLYYNALSIGTCGVYTKIYRNTKTSTSEAFQYTGTNILRKFCAILWMSLWISLWSLLLVIPGIIKAYAYSMTSYILNEYPSLTARQAVRLSNKITQGYKIDLFNMELSFFGWNLLSVLTFGILTFVFVAPYQSITTAGYYTELMETAIRDGRVTREELGMSAMP